MQTLIMSGKTRERLWKLLNRNRSSKNLEEPKAWQIFRVGKNGDELRKNQREKRRRKKETSAQINPLSKSV